MKNTMTVKELKDLLNRFNDEDEVEVLGGEDSYGEWAELTIDGETILER